MSCVVLNIALYLQHGLGIISELESEAPLIDKMLISGVNSSIAHQKSKETNLRHDTFLYHGLHIFL